MCVCVCAPVGDEVGFTHNGNNNWYGHDKSWTQLNWDFSDEQRDLFRFVKELINVRLTHPTLRRAEFLGWVGTGLFGHTYTHTNTHTHTHRRVTYVRLTHPTLKRAEFLGWVWRARTHTRTHTHTHGRTQAYTEVEDAEQLSG